MRTRLALAALLLAGAAVVAPAPAQAASAQVAAAATGYVKVGYFVQWGIYRRNFLVRNLHTSGMAAKLTHINYAFANVGADGRCFEANEAGVGDAWADYQKRFKAGESVDGVGDVVTQPLAGNFNQLRKLKAMYPNLKVLLSLGGWTWSKYFSDAALTPASRQTLVASCIDLFIKGNLPLIGTSPHGGPGSAYGVFDGFDLDWEWPGSEGNAGNVVRPQDKQNFTLLAAEFRSQLAAYGAQVGRVFQLTAFLPADPAKISAGVEPALFNHLDFGNVQGYDLVGAWDPKTGHQSNLYSTASSPFSVDLAVDTYLAQGVPAAKIVVGIPYYGRGWTGVASTGNGLYQAASGPARGTYEDGVDDYKKVVAKQGPVFYDPVAGAAWKYGSSAFWSYDTPQVIAQKTAYIKANGLGGSMAWSLDGDTATGELTAAIHNGLN
ncbi:glycoside hydrolase family 18 protein [Catellatospora sp. KI3]|uniref:glycoside hydrolase family 18 protein n=1 Tax=Catellatospora sp. KI3 TaxID=3041620 RepID=UPI00248323C2|nr:glycoside hydrolase family 18 protein [Catellatospora sp. KI3]MDI1463166.1 glycoside hydrolase family 18 protein [Catellatospora sp. KI3]